MAEEEVDYEAAEEEEEPAAAADEEAAAADGAAAAADEDDDDDEEDLETMKARLKEMEAEAAKLQEMQNKVEQEMGTDKAAGEGEGGAAGANAASREEVDARSVYVGNVDYAVTPEELQVHFQSCGTVNRVTILSDRFGNPKGFAYVEFLEPDAVANALLLAESELHGRQLRVSAKRTNTPGMRGGRGGGRGRGRFGRGRGRGRFGGYGRGRGRGYSPY